ncbi:50S ribosomal protein L15e [Candidatus Pacearchaeota archaeon]|nr:50S ribosomal protein L15e [Candidatus Pacearchaeota archaeon]
MKSAYDYIKENLRAGLRNKLIQWRAEDSAVRLEKPSDIGRARNLGYKDKKGYVIMRIKLKRGGRRRIRVNKGRRSKRQTGRKTLKMNYRWVAEQRAARRFPNLEVLNSYEVAKDGQFYFFEVIMIDTSRPEIIADKTINWMCRPENQSRAFRGLTSAGKKSRGLYSKSRNLKIRPSLRSWDRKGK